MTWFRIECGAADDRLFDQLGEALGISTGEAFYHYFAFTGRLAAEDTSGNMRDLLDRTIEKWGKWMGTPGGFSRVLRGLCEDPETGELRGFRKRNEKLLEKQARDRKKKKNPSPLGDKSSDPSKTRAGFSGEPPSDPRANGNVDRTTTTTTTARTIEPAVGSPRHLALAGRMTDERYRSALEGYLRAAHDPPRLLADFESIASGMSGPGGRPVTPDLLGQALHEMAIAGAKCTSRILAAFVRREMEPSPEPKHGNGKPLEATKVAATEAAGDAWSRRRQHA